MHEDRSEIRYSVGNDSKERVRVPYFSISCVNTLVPLIFFSVGRFIWLLSASFTSDLNSSVYDMVLLVFCVG